LRFIFFFLPGPDELQTIAVREDLECLVNVDQIDGERLAYGVDVGLLQSCAERSAAEFG
jgi:hypothetical protein